MRNGGHRGDACDGYAMAVLLIAIAVMGVALSVAMPVWRTVVQREREEELIFRGKQYTRAIGLFQRRFANAYPPSFDVLVEQKFLRKKYKDPVSADGEFQPVYQNSALSLNTPGRAGQAGAGTAAGQRQAGSGQFGGSQTGFTLSSQGPSGGGRAAGPQGPMIGVVSKNKDVSIKIYEGHTHYNEWLFIYLPQQQPGRGGAAVPGGRGGGRGQGQDPGRGFGFPGGSGPGRGQGGPGRGRGPGRG